MILDIENWLWKSDLGTFWRPMWTSVKVKSKIYFSFTDFFAKIKPLLTHGHKIPPLRSDYCTYIYCAINRKKKKLTNHWGCSVWWAYCSEWLVGRLQNTLKSRRREGRYSKNSYSFSSYKAEHVKVGGLVVQKSQKLFNVVCERHLVS